MTFRIPPLSFAAKIRPQKMGSGAGRIFFWRGCAFHTHWFLLSLGILWVTQIYLTEQIYRDPSCDPLKQVSNNNKFLIWVQNVALSQSPQIMYPGSIIRSQNSTRGVVVYSVFSFLHFTINPSLPLTPTLPDPAPLVRVTTQNVTHKLVV